MKQARRFRTTRIVIRRVAKWLLVMAALCVVLVTAAPTRATVHLNIQWDEDSEQWRTLPLEGDVAINRSYQNAYGVAKCICSGPPFILSTTVAPAGLLGSLSGTGSFLAETSGEAKNPCDENQECPDESYRIEFHGDAHDHGSIRGSGSRLQFEGTASDPIIFTGYVDVSNEETQNGSAHTATFRNCEVREVAAGSGLFELGGSDVVIDRCTFLAAASGQSTLITADENHVTPDERRYALSITNSTFEANFVRGFEIIRIARRRSVVLENNLFAGNIMDPVIMDKLPAVVHFYPAVFAGAQTSIITRIRDNHGYGNTVNAIEANGPVPGETRIRTSDDLPLIVHGFRVEEGGRLHFESGSVVKMPYGGGTTPPDRSLIQAEGGEVLIEGSVITSLYDDAHGGDTDLSPPWDPVKVGTGIRIHPGARLVMEGSLVEHLEHPVIGEGEVVIRDSAFADNSGGIRALGNSDQPVTLERVSSRRNVGSGFSFENGATQVLPREVRVSDSHFSGNTVGIGLDLLEDGAFDVVVRDCRISSNYRDGISILASGGPLRGVEVIGSVITSNDANGINAQRVFVEDMPLRLEGNLIAGNGLGLATFGGSGAVLAEGAVDFVNNSVVWNRGFGYVSELSSASQRERVVNNLFTGNGSFGYFRNYGWVDPTFAHNLFWDNDAADEIYLPYESVTYRTIEALQALGGEWATNRHIDPVLEEGLAGTVASIAYDEALDESTLVDTAAPFAGIDVARLLVNPNTADDRLFSILRGSADSLVIEGDIGGVASPGDSYRLFDFHLATTSPAIDGGRNDEVLATRDLDGDARVADGDGDGIATVEIGADELPPRSATPVTVTRSAIRATYADAADPDASFGDAPLLELASASPSASVPPRPVSVGFVAWGLSSLPADVRVLGAEIELVLERAPTDPARLVAYRVLGSWEENDLTWNDRPAVFASELASLDLPATPQSVVLPGGSELIAAVEHWLRSPEQNHGLYLALVSDELDQSLDAALESDDSEMGPVLRLLLLPEPGASASVAAAALVLALLARTQRGRRAVGKPARLLRAA